MKNSIRTLTCTLIGACVLLISCGSSKKNTTEEKKYPQLEKGKVIRSVKLLSDSTQSFAVYLPKNYDTTKLWPVIIAFDPHADGALPVEKYDSLAELYGYIFVASNNSKNGMKKNETHTIATNLIADIKTRFKVDQKRVYLMGFSGGGRVAGSTALSDGGIAGVISCSAGLNAMVGGQPLKTFAFYGIAGDGDFNYLEMLTEEPFLKKQGFDLFLQKFSGTHEWPPVNCVADAFVWMQLKAMRDGAVPKEDAFIQKIITAKKSEAAMFEKQGNATEAFASLYFLLTGLNKLTDVKEFNTELIRIMELPAYQKASDEFRTLMNSEIEKQKEYRDAFDSKDKKWWEAELNTRKAGAKSKDQKGASNRRLLGMIGILSYSYCNSAIQSHRDAELEKYLFIYLTAEPDNTEAHYMNAILMARQDKKKEAFVALNTAVDKGFADKPRLMNDQEFSKINTDQDFQKILNRIK
ncbi:MAG: hypothetical protein V2A54_10455 [Bacteroidota bacterium]